MIDSNFFNYSSIDAYDVVYVPLEQQGNYWVATKGIKKTKPNNGTVFIKGKIYRFYNNKATITYGIEEYFIQEKTGQRFDFSGKEMAAKVIINKNGDAVLRNIYIDNKIWQ